MEKLKNIRVLFIDDEEMICTMANDYFEMNGYDINAYGESLKALDAFVESPLKFDIIVTDQTMPGITGYELLSRISDIRSDIPKILCTGYSEQVDELKKNIIGINAFFHKPYHFEDLIDQIEKLV